MKSAGQIIEKMYKKTVAEMDRGNLGALAEVEIPFGAKLMIIMYA